MPSRVQLLTALRTAACMAPAECAQGLTWTLAAPASLDQRRRTIKWGSTAGPKAPKNAKKSKDLQLEPAQEAAAIEVTGALRMLTNLDGNKVWPLSGPLAAGPAMQQAPVTRGAE